MPDDVTTVSRRALNTLLLTYFVIAVIAGYLSVAALRAAIAFYPLSVVMSFAVPGLLLFPGYRIWKESRGRLLPHFLPFAGAIAAVSVVIFVLSWLGMRAGLIPI